MKQNPEDSRLLRPLFIGVCIVIIIAGMHTAQTILVLLLLAAFITLLCLPLLNWLLVRSIPPFAAVGMIICMLLGTLALLAVLVGTSLEDLYRNLPEYRELAVEELAAVTDWLNRYGLPASQDQILKYFDPGIVFDLGKNVLGGLGTGMTYTIIIFLAVIFMLGEATYFSEKLQAATGNRFKNDFFTTFTGTIQRYMTLKTCIGLIKGILVGILAAIIGVDYAMVWGFVAFLFNYIPNIGPTMAALPAILLAFIDPGPWSAVYLAVGYLVINVLIGDLLEPRIMGRGMGLSTLVVFLSLVTWAWILGPVGLFLSVPLTMIIKIALDSNDETRWIAILLGPEEQTESEAPKQND